MTLKSMKFRKSEMDPCLYYKWTDNGLLVWTSWVDDCMLTESEKEINVSKIEMMNRFECDDLGDLKEDVGCKILCDKENRSIKMTQPLISQSFQEKFEIKDGRKITKPAAPGEALMDSEDGTYISDVDMRINMSGVGKLLYLSKWSRPDIQNATREFSK
jgi:Reverse transcriptase (RNA-dependent DNA polymerase)